MRQRSLNIVSPICIAGSISRRIYGGFRGVLQIVSGTGLRAKAKCFNNDLNVRIDLHLY